MQIYKIALNNEILGIIDDKECSVQLVVVHFGSLVQLSTSLNTFKTAQIIFAFTITKLHFCIAATWRIQDEYIFVIFTNNKSSPEFTVPL